MLPPDSYVWLLCTSQCLDQAATAAIWECYIAFYKPSSRILSPPEYHVPQRQQLGQNCLCVSDIPLPPLPDTETPAIISFTNNKLLPPGVLSGPYYQEAVLIGPTNDTFCRSRGT